MSDHTVPRGRTLLRLPARLRRAARGAEHVHLERALRAARESEERFRLLSDAAFEAVVVHVEGRIVEVNRAFTATFGYSEQEALRLTVYDLVVEEDREVLAERIRAGGDTTYEVIGATRYGDERYLQATGRTIPFNGGLARVVTMRDITERKLAEEQVGVLAYQYAADLTVVSDVARRLPRTADANTARSAICQAVLEVCDGMLAVLMEPDGHDSLVSTAVAGPHTAPVKVAVDEDGSATAEVFSSGEPFFIADLTLHGDISQRLVDASGAVSALWQPVLRDGGVVGVLLVAWDREVGHLSDRAAAVVGLFAAEAAVAIERADFLAQFEELNRTLAMQVEALRLSDQFKTDFVSSVSHELRTPLASILGYLDVLTEGELGELSEEQTGFLNIIDHNARRLLTLINDLLTLSGLESGKMIIRPRPCDLCALVEIHVQDQLPTIVARSQQVELSLPNGPVTASVDPERIGQVLANLIANAVKFTPEGGSLEVSLEATAERAVIRVDDRGIGISPEDVDRLFERFFRAKSATDQAIPGTGLGLAICKGIVDAHRGALSVESELGRGSSFRVELMLDVPVT